VLIFSLEMSREQLAIRLLCSEARVDSTRVRGGFLTGDDHQELVRAGDRLYNAPIFIDDSPSLSPLDVRTKARRMAMDKGLGLIVIDYLQLMKGPPRKIERRELEISEISRSLKSLAKELDVPVLALSQLNRKVEERGDKRPQLSDLRESGALEQDADVILFIYREAAYAQQENASTSGVAEINVAKQRNGPTGRFKLTFLSECTRFETLEERYAGLAKGA
ncbi:MAG: DnaB-like helicase C-terminal domain-containing protein, partial [Deltaproteobacteria bacterium]|nr:DnaB-like helicase C-terminal domain-containing protein [Deltaproteobacteria bacterium]